MEDLRGGWKVQSLVNVSFLLDLKQSRAGKVFVLQYGLILFWLTRSDSASLLIGPVPPVDQTDFDVYSCQYYLFYRDYEMPIKKLAIL